MSTYTISLIDNANGFFGEAVEKAVLAESIPLQWKYAILFLVQAIELSLKERLRQEHEVLIYADVDKRKHTVSLSQCLERLAGISAVSISAEDRQAVHTAMDWRNHLVHHQFAFDVTTLKPVFARLLGFYYAFSREHLNQDVFESLSQQMRDEALAIKEYGDAIFERVRERIAEEGIESRWVWTCRSCGWDAFVVEDDINKCYQCGREDPVVCCEDCSEPFFLDEMKEVYIGNYKRLHAHVHVCSECAKKRDRVDDAYYSSVR